MYRSDACHQVLKFEVRPIVGVQHVKRVGVFYHYFTLFSSLLIRELIIRRAGDRQENKGCDPRLVAVQTNLKGSHQ